MQRTSPVNSDFFFKGLYKNFFSVTGFVREDNPKKDIQNLFKDFFSLKIQRDPFYDYWLDDMAQICKIFCAFLRLNSREPFLKIFVSEEFIYLAP